MKYTVELDVADSVFVQFLRNEADIVWHAINYFRKTENPKEYEIQDFWYNYQLLGAMYLVEEYFTDNPEIRKMYPRDEQPEEVEWMAWDD